MPAILALLDLIFPIALIARSVARAETFRQALEDWAKNNGFQITRLKRSRYSLGPYQRGATGTETVYRIDALDREKNLFKDWAYCYGGSTVTPPSRIDVHWDDVEQ